MTTGHARSRRIAITGASGFIGRNLTEYLSARGDDVRPVARNLFWSPDLVDAFRNVDAVVHLAGVSEAARASVFRDVNVEGTRVVAVAAAKAGSQVIHLSSLAATGTGTRDRPRNEDHAPAPLTPYGASKLDSERVLAASGVRWTVLRPGPVYGPWDRAFLQLFTSAKRGVLPLTGRADACYTFIYIGDLVRTIAAAVDASAGHQIIHVGHARPIVLRELVEGIRRVVNPAARIVPVPLRITQTASSVMHGVAALTGRAQAINRWRYSELAAEGFVANVDRMRRVLGVEAETSLEDGLKMTAGWYRNAGWI